MTQDDRLTQTQGRGEWAHQIADSNMVGVMHWKFDGQVLDANDRLLEIIGYTREDMDTGRVRWLEMTPPEFMDVEYTAWTELSEKGACTPFRKEYIRRDGSRVPILIGGALLQNSTEEGVSFVLDLSEQVRSENSLRENSALLRSILDSANDGILVIGFDGRIVASNRTFAEMWHIPMSVLKQGEDSIVLGYVRSQLKDPEEFLNRVQALYFSDEITRDEVEFKDGRVFDRYSKPHVVDERQLGRIWTFRDVTEKRRWERGQLFLNEATEVLSSSLDFQATLEHLAKLAVPRIADGCVVTLAQELKSTRAATCHVNSEKNMVLARYFQKFVPSKDRNWGPVSETLRTGLPVFLPEVAAADFESYRFPLEARDLVIDLAIRSAIIVPLRLREQNIGVLILMTDQSGRKLDRSELELAQELARRASIAMDNSWLFESAHAAVQSRDEFISIASHELKTPLTALTLQLEVLSGEVSKVLPSVGQRPVEAVVAKLLQHALLQTGQMTQLVNELLDLTQIRTGRIELRLSDFDMCDAIKEVLDRFRLKEELLPKGIVLNVRCAEQEEQQKLHGRWDRMRIQQVLSNLISNAIKYGEGSPVTVHLEGTADCVTFAVEDQGPGMPQEKLEKLFQPFERGQVSRNTPGLGLGLFISRRIVEEHGGQITVQSQVGRGSVFRVELPRN